MVDLKSYSNDAYVGSAYYVTSAGQVTEMKKI